MSTSSVYLSYNDYFLDYNKESFTMRIGYNKTYFTAKIKSNILNGFDKCEDTYILENLGVVKKVTYYNSEKTLLITFKADKNGISVFSDADIDGVFEYDDSYNILPMRLDKRTNVTRTSLGKGVSKYDNALFDRNNDSAVVIDGSNINFGFDFEKNNYTLCGKCEFTFRFKKDIYEQNFCVPYGKMNKNNTFGKMPPVGWMTWYAVKFDASEKTEPTAVGADLMAGSLIKNPGGGIAENGGYICGRRDLVELCSYRLSTPGLGREVGASLGHNRSLFMGLFNAPHVVGEALKTAVFAAAFINVKIKLLYINRREKRCTT